MAYKGKFAPRNPKKYMGDPSNIVYRSLWERKFMVWCDETESVVDWQSEEFSIPYRSPLDKKLHRYFPDVLITTRQKDGTLKKKLIEIKPSTQTKEPVKKSKTTKKYIREVTTYLVNKAKWDAATAFCADKGWEFIKITENELFPKKPK